VLLFGETAYYQLQKLLFSQQLPFSYKSIFAVISGFDPRRHWSTPASDFHY